MNTAVKLHYYAMGNNVMGSEAAEGFSVPKLLCCCMKAQHFKYIVNGGVGCDEF